MLQATYTLIRSDNMCMSHIHTHKPVRKWLRVCGSLFTVLTTIFSGKFPKMAIKAQNVYFYFLSGYVASYRRIKMLLFIREGVYMLLNYCRVVLKMFLYWPVVGCFCFCALQPEQINIYFLTWTVLKGSKVSNILPQLSRTLLYISFVCTWCPTCSQ